MINDMKIMTYLSVIMITRKIKLHFRNLGGFRDEIYKKTMEKQILEASKTTL